MTDLAQLPANSQPGQNPEQYSRVHHELTRLHAELDQARATIHRQGDQLAHQHAEITQLREQRDRWIARTVQAEDQITIDQARTGEQEPPPAEVPGSPPPAPSVTVTLMTRCTVCGSNLATHLFIRDHRFQITAEQ